MKFGTLQVALLTGETRDFPIDLPSVIVGRGEGATILLDDFSVSRRHARLTVDSGRLMVEDLASAAGTFINGERLAPNIRYLVDDGAELRFGDLDASYSPPPPADAVIASTDEDGAAYSPTGLHVALVSPAVAIDAGRQATATVTVTNRGRVVDTVSVEVTDLPPDWYTIETTRASLLPGTHLEVTVRLHPPRRHDSLAGHYDFTVAVSSQSHQREAIAIGHFEVLPFESFGLAFEAIRSGRNFRLIAENRGNEPVRYALAGQDDEQAFRYQFDAPVVHLQPGQKQVVALKVRRPRQLFGPKIAHPFEVVGTTATGSEVRARGQLSVAPPLQKFRMPALFTLAALILGVTALAILILTDGESIQTAGAEDEYAGVHLCDEEGAQEKQEEKNQDAASEAPNTSAVVAGLYDGGRPIFGQTDANGAPFFAQNDPRWGSVEYARSTELPAGKDWCGTTISQCGCAMTSVAVMLALYNVVNLPDGQPLTPQSLNAWFNGDARRTDRGWVSRGYIYGDVIWTAANELSGEIARANPGTPTVRFVRTGTGSEDEIRAELRAGRPIILEVPGHWIAAVGLDGDTILINDPFYRDRTTLDAYKGKVRSSVLYETSGDLSAVVLTAPADVKFKVTDRQGRVVSTGDTAGGGTGEPVNQIPGASFSAHRAWRDPTCIEKAPPTGAGTNQIMLPGSRDDYTIEILGTGDQAGSIAIHTYGRDGTGSIATIEGQEGTTAELGFDPNAPQPTVRVPNGNVTTTATPDSGGEGGGPGDETPTPAPTPSATPTPTGTPFVESRTNITLSAEPGQTRVETAGNTGFELGDPIRFAPGLPNEEDNLIVGFGSFLLATPLKFAHGPGEPILRLPRPPGQGPGLPPGITPPAQTGPLLPPDTVGLACSTIYQPSPKQATFICDLQVTGDYTNTRWSLNGQTVTDFTGSSSFLMAFNDDTPATVSATVCNVTICRSVTRAERIVFPANLSGTTFTGPGGTGTGAPPVVTPPAGGAVAIVCATEFPITPDGQLAQFTCQASFSGDFTSISWSAPGGTPANQSGKSKTFTTTVRNVEGAPVSLKVTATVCNFGTCRTSEPTTVGIGRTITTLESSPDGQVNSGHRLTLMARVDGIGGVVPQGGTVQFFADGFEFGPSATLFTVGKVAVAQVAVETTGLTTGPEPGAPHAFKAHYSGGINAFGSESAVRVINVLPPIPDGCDSVNNDADTGDDVTDGTCTFATPRNLGGGTVLNDLSINGQTGPLRNTVVVEPGDKFTVAGNAGRTDYCPGCIRQVYIGIGENLTSGTPAMGPVCYPVGILPATNPGVPMPPVEFTAPSRPGVYYLRATTTLDYFCVGPQVGPPESSVGRVIVRQPVRPDLEVRDAAGTAQVTEINEGQKLTLFARVPEGITGRVNFTATGLGPDGTDQDTDPDLVTVTAGGGALIAAICPPSGELRVAVPAGSQVVPCTPREARIVTDALPGLLGPLTVTAEYFDPNPLRLVDPTTGLPGVVPIRVPTGPPTSSPASIAVRILATPAISVTAVPNPVEMGASFTLSATVTSQNVGLGITGEGGTVQFKAGSQNIGQPVTVGAGGLATLSWTAGINPCAPSGTCGGAPFDAKDDTNRSLYSNVHAVFSTGTSNLQGGLSPNINVDINPALSTTAITSVTSTSTPPRVGDTLTITATVTGSNSFSPDPGAPGSPGKVQFRVRMVSPQATVQNIGSPVDVGNCNTFTLECTATTTIITGDDQGPMPDADGYELSAVFLGTDQLAGSTSADFPITLDSQNPTIDVTLPTSGTITVGDATSVVRVVVDASGRKDRLNDNCPGDSTCGDIELLGTGAATPPSGPVVELGNNTGIYGREFLVSDLSLNANDYTISARYTGNRYFSERTSATKSLTVDPFEPSVDMNAITPVAVGNELTVSAIVTCSGGACSGLRALTGGSVSFYKDSVAPENLLGTDTSIDSGGGASISTATGDIGLLKVAETPYSIVARYNGNATNGNTVAVTSTAGTVTLTKRNSRVSVENATAVLGSDITLKATVEPTSPPTSTVSLACTGCLQFQINVAGTWTDISSDVEVSATGAATLTVGTGSGAFPANGSYSIRAVFATAGITATHTNYNGATSGSGTATVGPPPPTVSLEDATMPLNGTTNLVAVITPPSGRNPTCSGCVAFKVGATLESATTFTTGSVALVSTEYRASVLITGGTPEFNATQSYKVWAVYQPTGGTGAAGTTDDVGGPAASNEAAVTVTARTVTVSVSAPASVTLGNSITLTATLSPAAAPGNIRFFADDVDVSDAVTADTTDGITTFNWSPPSVGDGTATITASYTSSDAGYASQATSTSTNVTINPATTSLVATAVQTGAAGTTLTFTADLTSAFGAKTDIDGGTVTFSISGSACTGMAAVTVTDGVATLTGVTCTPGTRQVTGTYSGSGYYAASDDTSNFQIVVA